MEHADEQTPDSDSPRDTANGSPNKDSGAHLTPMPDYLMRWWTPIAIAGLLLSSSSALAVFWRGTAHWPSGEAMRLCATIAGAGFAFAVWQQRSHDNALREEKKQEDDAEQAASIKREEYWKRREHAYRLLTSNNPGSRLGAVELLVELADMTAEQDGTPTEEEEQFQQHIVTMLCSQIRHEGLLIESEGTEEEHASIQDEIFSALLERVNQHNIDPRRARWQTCNLNLSYTEFHTPVILSNTAIHQTLNLTHSTFHRDVVMSNTTLSRLSWAYAKLLSPLKVSSCELHLDQFPERMKQAEFSKSVFGTAHGGNEPPLLFPLSTPDRGREEANEVTFIDDCHFTAPFTVRAQGSLRRQSSERIGFTDCHFRSVEITGSIFQSLIRITRCTFTNDFHIHNLHYELGAVAEADMDAIGRYFKGDLSAGAEVADWEATFPGHPFHKTARIDVSHSTFAHDADNPTIEVRRILCYDGVDNPTPNDDLISFSDNKSDRGAQLSLEHDHFSCDPDRGCDYVIKTLESTPARPEGL